MKKSYVKTDELCSYLQFMGKRKVFASQIMKHFNIKTKQNLIRRLKKIPCIRLVSESVLGSTRKTYRVYHSEPKHIVRKHNELEKKEVSELAQAWGGDFAKYKREIEPHLKRSETFDPALDFEVHGLRWISPSIEVLPNMEGIFDVDIEWTWCDFHINANKGRLLVFTKPNKHFAKYGLNKQRYDEFIGFRDSYLKDRFGYSAGMFLEPIAFDLHQDDWRYEFKGSWEGTDIVAGVTEQYKLTLQRYKIKRSDRPEDTDRYIKRFEVRFKTLKTVAHLGEIIPHVLSLDADRVQAIANLEAHKQETKRERQFFLDSTKTLINSIAGVTEKIIDVETIVHQVASIDQMLDGEILDQNDFRSGLTRILENQTNIVNSYAIALETIQEELDAIRSDINIHYPAPKNIKSRIKRLFKR